ncbi:urea-proton symporter DUR3-like [Haliotis rufescens]|uniref:urea-proton symporter DUR3-like n=1 Tax=Haliotis rufescens TaxID=6454 RepID=UPI00201F6FAF|nr:urea-proton symporter DUR3-like [Haliotis rufescens]
MDCEAIQKASSNLTRTMGIQPTIQMWQALLAILGTGFFAALMASLFGLIRKHIYNDVNNLDTAFDAGGTVNAGLTATTIVSQWTWAATLLQSSTVASKYGISGPFWYAAGATIQILLFATLSVQLKIRAPGAKTFLQVIRARFGRTTHKVFCAFALTTNIIVTAMLMLGGAAVITSLVKDISLEYATTLVAITIGGYTFIGGLGATFYVSYFNTAIIYVVMIIFLLKVYGDDSPDNPLGSIQKVYTLLSCSTDGPEGNTDGSYLTLVSNPGLMFGLINIVGNFGTVFVDQSYWQSSVAAKPKQGVVGFLCGGIAWFAVPFCLATTMGLAYIALSTSQGGPLLTADDVDAGLVPPVVAQKLFGRQGEILMLLMVLMAITSTGSSEVMAVTSIMVYDIYGLYLKPYRLMTDTNSCILCGKGRGRMANPRDKCVCESMTYCTACHSDDKAREVCRRAIKPEYKCTVHGSYRVYNDLLLRLKSWCLVWTTFSILPLTVILSLMQLSLGWVYLFMGILIGSAVIPITLSMFWERLTSAAMMAGSIGGAIIAIVVWLSVASTYPGGLDDFLINTGQELSMLCGNLTAILSGGMITIVVSLVTNRSQDPSKSREIWEQTRDVDNPLCPWTEKYAQDLCLTGAHQLDNRPSLQEVEKTFKKAKYFANIGSVVFSLLLVVVWPCIMIAVDIMSYDQFFGWAMLSEVWAFAAMVIIILFPAVNEAYDIYQAFYQKQKVVPVSSLPKTSASLKHASAKPETGISLTQSSISNGKDHGDAMTDTLATITETGGHVGDEAEPMGDAVVEGDMDSSNPRCPEF